MKNQKMQFSLESSLEALLILTFLTLFIHGEAQIHDTEKIICLESLNTKRETSACPRNNDEYIVRAKAMACDKVHQDCTSPQKFKYHCVLNVWGNVTVEVCAEEKIIVGRKCTEYSHGGAFLQEHYENSCTSCPYLYNSSDVHLYQECFQFQSLSVGNGGRKNETDKKNIEDSRQIYSCNLVICIVAITLSVILVVWKISRIGCYVHKRRRRHDCDSEIECNGGEPNHEHEESLKDPETKRLKIEDATPENKESLKKKTNPKTSLPKCCFVRQLSANIN